MKYEYFLWNPHAEGEPHVSSWMDHWRCWYYSSALAVVQLKEDIVDFQRSQVIVHPGREVRMCTYLCVSMWCSMFRCHASRGSEPGNGAWNVHVWFDFKFENQQQRSFRVVCTVRLKNRAEKIFWSKSGTNNVQRWALTVIYLPFVVRWNQIIIHVCRFKGI